MSKDIDETIANIEEVDDTYLSELIIKLLVYPKDSDTYKEIFTNTLKTKVNQLGEKTQAILKLLDVTLENGSFTENNIKKWPNLFSGSIENADYVKFLDKIYEISKSKLLTSSILNHLISYLDDVDLENESCIKNHHMISILYMLFYFFYGENGCNFLKAHENRKTENQNENMAYKHKSKTKDEIGNYLSDYDDVSLQDKIDFNFLKACEFLKKLLHHKKHPNLNFKARDICQYFTIKLDISLMIRLCVNGVKQENEDIENLAMFIGTSGSGKSTTINYLYGIDYRLVCSSKTQKYFLRQIDENVIAPAKVGHGNVSETLYPKIVKKEFQSGFLSFCDFPGFDDTRDETYKACASLGLPIAVHYAKKRSIDVIVVVIDWETIMLLRGDQVIKTMNTVQSLMKNLSSSSSSVKFLYAITRPPLPPRIEYFDLEVESEADYCDSNKIAEKVFKNLNANISKLKDEFCDFEKKSDNDIERLKKKTSDLKTCKNIFHNLRLDSFESRGLANGFGLKISFLKLIDTSGVVKKGTNAMTKQNIMRELKNDALIREMHIDDLVNERIGKFIDQILKELESKSDQKEKIIDDLIEKETQKIVKEIEESDTEIKEIEKKINDKLSLLNFLETIKADDIYIIRGFKLDGKWDDHKEKLLERIKCICDQNNCKTDKASVRIDNRSNQFSVVFDWAKRESNSCEKILMDVVKEIEKIEELKIIINELEERIQVDEDNLKRALVSSRDNENEIIKMIGKKLNSLNEKKEKVDKELEQTSKDIDEMKKSIRDIEESPAIEYGSEVIVEKRNKLTRYFGFQTDYLYKFPRVYYEKPWNLRDWWYGERKSHNFPIDSVEISCLVNKEEKIVFKTPLNLNSINSYMSYNKIVIANNVKEKPSNEDQRIKTIWNGENTKFNITGEIKILDSNLNDGFLKIEYKSFEGKDGFAGFRCFVKPIHFPDNKLKIKELLKKIDEKRNVKIELKNTLEDVTKDIGENSDYLDCLKKGLHDEQKGKHLLQLLLDLEYSFDDFIVILMKEIKEENTNAKQDIEWLEIEAEKEFVELKKLYVNYYIKRIHRAPNNINMSQISKNLFRNFVFGTDEDLINQEIEKLNKDSIPIQNFDFNRLLRLYTISFKSGIPFRVLSYLVKSLKNSNSNMHTVSAKCLKQKLKNQRSNLAKAEKSLISKSEILEKNKWKIDILNIVVEVLDYQKEELYIKLIEARNKHFLKTNSNTEPSPVNISLNDSEIKSNKMTAAAEKKQNPLYKILCIDGGGVRGIIPALILDRLEKRCQKPISQLFTMISGTSTGGIIAVMLSLPKDSNPLEPKYSAENAVEFYKTESCRIFESKTLGLSQQYSNSNLKEILIQSLNGAHLSCALIDLIIPAVNEAEIDKTHIFESRKAKTCPGENQDLFDVVMATTAAPTFFQPHKIDGLGCFVDGGLRANNPSLIAYTHHRDYLKEESEETKRNVFVLSIGTGAIHVRERGAQDDDSLLFWAQNATRYAISGHAADIDRQMKCLLDENSYVRLQVDLERPVSLDNYKMLSELESLTLEKISGWEKDGTFDLIIDKLID